MRRVIAADRRALAARGIDYRGVLYAGIMMTADGPEGARVQRALRRSRVPGPDDAPASSILSTLFDACIDRRPRRAAPRWEPRRSGLRGHGGRGLSRRASQGRRDRRARRRGAREGAGLPRRHAPRRAGTLADDRRARARRDCIAATSTAPRSKSAYAAVALYLAGEACTTAEDIGRTGARAVSRVEDVESERRLRSRWQKTKQRCSRWSRS